MSAGKAANIIRIMSDKANRDPRFLEAVTSKIVRGEKCLQKAGNNELGLSQ